MVRTQVAWVSGLRCAPGGARPASCAWPKAESQGPCGTRAARYCLASRSRLRAQCSSKRCALRSRAMTEPTPFVDLRPGVYTVTFSLTGFSTVKREGIELPASFTATVSVAMQVGAIEETMTVSGETPLVDTHNATSQVLYTTAMLETLPSNSRSPQSFAALTPGVRGAPLSQAPGGVDDMGASAHGGAASDYTIDGMTTATINGMQGGSITFRVAQAYVAEIAVTTGGGTAESSYGNMITNVIPKEGGNTFSGSFYAEYTDESLAASNLTDELRGYGFTSDSLTKTLKFLEISPAFGGRLLRDKLWFFTSYKTYEVVTVRQSVYDNLTPRGNVYTPDLTRPAELKLTQISRNARLTWQAAQKHKFSVFVDNAPQIAWHRGRDAQLARSHQLQPVSAEHLHDAWVEVADQQSVAPRGLARAQLIELRPAPAHDRDVPVQRAGRRLRRDFQVRIVDQHHVGSVFDARRRCRVEPVWAQRLQAASVPSQRLVHHRLARGQDRHAARVGNDLVRAGAERRLRPGPSGITYPTPSGCTRRRSDMKTTFTRTWGFMHRISGCTSD